MTNVIMFILMTGMNTISVMLEDKTKFTMLRMYVAPVRRWEISAGYFMYMQQISYVIPQRWLLDAIEKLASGASLSSITLHLGILILFTIICISIGSIALRPAKQSA